MDALLIFVSNLDYFSTALSRGWVALKHKKYVQERTAVLRLRIPSLREMLVGCTEESSPAARFVHAINELYREIK